MKNIFIFICLLFPFSLNAYYFPYTFTAARPMGMGNAYTAIAEGPNAMEYNPAGLANANTLSLLIDGNIIGYKYTERVTAFEPNFDISGFFTEYSGKISASGYNFSLSVENINQGDPKIETGIILYDAEGNTVESLDLYNMKRYISIALGYGLKLQSLSLGASARAAGTFRSDWKQINNNSLTVLFDIGATYKLTDEISLGLALLRFGGQLTKNYYSPIDKHGVYGPDTAEEPASLNAGVVFKPLGSTSIALDIRNIIPVNVLNLNSSVDAPAAFMPSAHLGAEHVFFQWLAARAGYMQAWEPVINYAPGERLIYESRTTATLGLGFKLEGFFLDLAAANDFRAVGNMHNPFQFFASAGYDFK